MRKVAQLTLLVATPLLLAFGCKNLVTNTNGTTNTTTSNTVVNTQQTQKNTNSVTTNTTQVTKLPQEEELQRLASAFAERYGSYSNQTNFANLEALLFFMTRAFQDRTNQFISTERAKQRDTTIYYGLTTRAVAVATQSYSPNSGSASFLVSTQQKEAIGTTGNVKTSQRDILIAMQREGEAWKVDAATWQ